jgi:hypothetical protein
MNGCNNVSLSHNRDRSETNILAVLALAEGARRPHGGVFDAAGSCEWPISRGWLQPGWRGNCPNAGRRGEIGAGRRIARSPREPARPCGGCA